MAGTSKDFSATEVLQSPADLWVIGTAPVDATPRVILASDGTPDSVTHGTCVHLGATNAVTTSTNAKINPIDLDQLDAPLDGFTGELEASIETELAQTRCAKLQRALGVGTFASGTGYEQLTFGGGLTVPTACIAAISQRRVTGTKYLISTLFKAAAVSGFTVAFGRSKASLYKVKFQGLADLTRTAGKQVGILHETLADAAGGTPTAKDFQVAEIYEGPCDLWVIDAPTNTDTRVTLDATTLTPDSVKHPNAKHLGATAGEVTMSVVPKVSMIRFDQFDAAVDVFIETLEAKIEAEMMQSSVEKLSRILSVGSFTTSAGVYNQTTFGGTDQPASYSVCAIAKKRTDPTKAAVMCLYKVHSGNGIEIAMSRKKTSSYKVSFLGRNDPTRTAGKQIGVFHEMV